MNKSKNTVGALIESIANSQRLKNLLKKNMYEKTEYELRMNLVWLTYDFDNDIVKIEYFVQDENYPPVEISFIEFEKFIV